MRDFDSIRSDMKSAMRRQASFSLEDLAAEFDELGTSEALAWAGNARGTAAIRRGDHAEALRQFELALDHFQRLPPEKNDEASIRSNIAMVHMRMGNYPKALDMLYQSLEGHLKRGDTENAANVTMNIGGIHYYLADYPSSLEYNERALAMYEGIGAVTGIASALGNIGSVYTMAGDHAKGLEYFYRQIDLYERHNMMSIMHEPLVNLATSHMWAKEYEKSLKLLDQALQVAIDNKDRHAEQYVMQTIGEVLVTRSSHAEAVPWFRRSLEVARAISSAATAAQSMINLIRALYLSGEVEEARTLLDENDSMMQPYPMPNTYRKMVRALLLRDAGAYDEAHTVLLDALHEATEHNLRAEMVEISKDLRDIAHLMRDLDLYVQYNAHHHQLADELHGAEATRRLGLQQKDRELALERARIQKQLDVLHAALPEHIAQRVSRGEVVHDHHDNAAVIFLDIVGFTTLSSQLDASGVVLFLESIFRQLDAVCERHNITAIKTIGDSYMAVAFSDQSSNSEQQAASPVCRAANAALDMLRVVSEIESPIVPRSTRNDSPTISFRSPEGSPERSPEGSHFSVRIGVHCGALTAGVLGTKRLQYDVWGDTVNVASRLESTGEPGKIHVSEAFAQSLSAAFLGLRPRNDTAREDDSLQMEYDAPVIPSNSEEHGTWHLALRGDIELKGKGQMTTYWLMP